MKSHPRSSPPPPRTREPSVPTDPLIQRSTVDFTRFVLVAATERLNLLLYGDPRGPQRIPSEELLTPTPTSQLSGASTPHDARSPRSSPPSSASPPPLTPRLHSPKSSRITKSPPPAAKRKRAHPNKVAKKPGQRTHTMTTRSQRRRASLSFLHLDASGKFAVR